MYGLDGCGDCGTIVDYNEINVRVLFANLGDDWFEVFVGLFLYYQGDYFLLCCHGYSKMNGFSCFRRVG